MVLFSGFFVLWMLFIATMVVVPFAFWIYSLIEVSKAPEQAFGPPWDNSKNAWITGLAVAIVIPAGMIVGGILWWLQGHKALRAGAPVPRPFWAPAPRPYQPYPGYPPPQLPPDQQV